MFTLKSAVEAVILEVIENSAGLFEYEQRTEIGFVEVYKIMPGMTINASGYGPADTEEEFAETVQWEVCIDGTALGYFTYEDSIMSVYHTIANTPGFTAKAINHFVAAVKDDEIVAVFNTKSRTVQVTDWTAAAVIDPTFENLESTFWASAASTSTQRTTPDPCSTSPSQPLPAD